MLLVAALPIVGWALLIGLAGIIAAPGPVLFLAAAALLIVLLFGGLGMLDAWFGKREAQRRAARVAAGGDYLSPRERKLKTAWQQGRAEREAERRPNAVAFVLGRLLAALWWTKFRRRPGQQETAR